MCPDDPKGQASLMLCESILHLLVEERVITKRRALEAINGVVELLQESDEIGQRRSTRCSAMPLLEAIARTFALKGSRRRLLARSVTTTEQTVENHQRDSQPSPERHGWNVMAVLPTPDQRHQRL
jgi:hypothetical protein